MPDYGTGRCDFPKGDAKALYNSVQNVLYKLPEETRVFVGHDYQPNGRELKFETTIAESKAHNKQLNVDTSEADYVEFRQSRDATLSPPKLLYPSIQVNIEAGRFPKFENNNKHYLKTPLNIQF
jgi:glyoxylase-like metal-dependent hydrolase (beta-lactamase superfamily II)